MSYMCKLNDNIKKEIKNFYKLSETIYTPISRAFKLFKYMF